MIVWTGLGWLIALTGALALVIAQYVSESVTGDSNYYTESFWVISLALVGAAAVTFLLTKSLLKTKTKVVVDKESGEDIVLKNGHSLFFIDSIWWPYAYVAIAAIVLVSKLL